MSVSDVNRPSRPVVVAVGVAQILAWGSSYYLIAVIAQPVATDTGWSLAWVVGGVSVGLLVAGLVSPWVGRSIDGLGGRPVLAASAVLLAAGLAVIGLSPELPVYLAGWVVLGVAMGMGLYDAAFASLGRMYGLRARGPITLVTLFAGFASTVCWPLSLLLVDAVGWRGACLAYAALDLAVVLPLYLVALPREVTRIATPSHPASEDSRSAVGGDRRAFLLLAIAFTIGSVIITVVSINLLTLLQSGGMTAAAAVAVGVVIGPSQVAARVAELAFGGRHSALWTLLVSTALVAVGLFVVRLGPGLVIVGLGVALYGAGAGLESIARGTVPLSLFGATGYATLMGRLAMPALVAQATAPIVGVLALERLGSGATLALLLAAAVVGILPVVGLMRRHSPATSTWRSACESRTSDQTPP